MADIGSLSFGELLKLLNSLGPAGFLLLALMGFYKQWWVFGWLYKQKSAEADEWKKAALEGTRLAETATGHAAKALASRRKPAE